MFFSKIQGDWSNLNVNTREQLSDPDGEHRLLWQFFGRDPDEDRPFLYRRVHDQKRPTFFVLSEYKPDDSGVQGFQLNQEDIKPYDPVISVGDTYRFNVRVNPTVKKDGKYHDVVMNQKYEWRQQDKPREEWPSDSTIEYRTGLEWIQKRDTKNGFTLIQKSEEEPAFSVTGHQKHKFNKQNSDHEITLTTMDLTGLLEVTDPDLFQDVLFTGLGRKSVYGCGFMMIQPVEAPNTSINK